MPLRRWSDIAKSTITDEMPRTLVAIHNSTSNCTIGVEDPSQRPSQLGCVDLDFLDPRLEHWTAVDEDSSHYPSTLIGDTNFSVSEYQHDTITMNITVSEMRILYESNTSEPASEVGILYKGVHRHPLPPPLTKEPTLIQ